MNEKNELDHSGINPIRIDPTWKVGSILMGFNEELCRILEPYFDVHLPQRDGILVEEAVVEGNSSAEAASRRAYEDDIAAIRVSDLLLAVFDGRTPDEGVCVEVGFAKALGIGIIGFKSDARVALPWGHNPMISGCVDTWIADLHELLIWAESVSFQDDRPMEKNE